MGYTQLILLEKKYATFLQLRLIEFDRATLQSDGVFLK